MYQIIIIGRISKGWKKISDNPLKFVSFLTSVKERRKIPRAVEYSR